MGSDGNVDWSRLGPKLVTILKLAAKDTRRRAENVRAIGLLHSAGYEQGRADCMSALAAEIESGSIMERVEELENANAYGTFFGDTDKSKKPSP